MLKAAAAADLVHRHGEQCGAEARRPASMVNRKVHGEPTAGWGCIPARQPAYEGKDSQVDAAVEEILSEISVVQISASGRPSRSAASIIRRSYAASEISTP